MATFLLIIIYIAFISLGLPDAILGAAWPIMQVELSAPLEAAGLLYGMVCVGTVLSSLMSGPLLKRFGTGKVTAVSVMLTAIGLFGFNAAESVYWLLLFTLPLGLGAGAVDAGLNDYVALHYKAHHMNWLHAFWGIGATMGPLVLGRFLTVDKTWRDAYFTIAICQIVLVIVIFVTLPLWTKVANNQAKFEENTEEGETVELYNGNIFKMPGVKWALLTFIFYVGIEQTVSLWGSSFLVSSKQLDPARAADWLSFYFLGITIGRFLSGFVSFKFTNKQLLRIGQIIILSGAVILLVPLPTIFSLIGLLMIGFGCAPVYPSMLHETPVRFGTKHSQTIMGLQLAAGNAGALLLPPVFGFIASHLSVNLLPLFLVAYASFMLFSTERVNLLTTKIKGFIKREAASITVKD